MHSSLISHGKAQVGWEGCVTTLEFKISYHRMSALQDSFYKCALIYICDYKCDYKCAFCRLSGGSSIAVRGSEPHVFLKRPPCTKWRGLVGKVVHMLLGNQERASVEVESLGSKVRQSSACVLAGAV